MAASPGECYANRLARFARSPFASPPEPPVRGRDERKIGTGRLSARGLKTKNKAKKKPASKPPKAFLLCFSGNLSWSPLQAKRKRLRPYLILWTVTHARYKKFRTRLPSVGLPSLFVALLLTPSRSQALSQGRSSSLPSLMASIVRPRVANIFVSWISNGPSFRPLFAISRQNVRPFGPVGNLASLASPYYPFGLKKNLSGLKFGLTCPPTGMKISRLSGVPVCSLGC